jgi:hypothetical protein
MSTPIHFFLFSLCVCVEIGDVEIPTTCIGRFFGIDAAWLPAVRSSSERYGHVAAGPLHGVPITSVRSLSAIKQNKKKWRDTREREYGAAMKRVTLMRAVVVYR